MMRVVVAAVASTVFLAASCKEEPKAGTPAETSSVAGAPSGATSADGKLVASTPLVGPDASLAVACAASERAPAIIEIAVGGGLEQATLYFDGAATSTLGKVRTFDTPELCRSKDYTYTVQFRWSGGQSEPKAITVRGGETSKVSMP